MARYQSRLKSVLSTRKQMKEKAQMAFMIEARLLAQEEAHLEELLDASRAAQDHLKARIALVSPAELQLYHDFIQHQKTRISGQKQVILRHIQACERKRSALEEATRHQKMIENLEAKHQAAYLSVLKRNDAQQLDEIAGQMKWKRR